METSWILVVYLLTEWYILPHTFSTEDKCEEAYSVVASLYSSDPPDHRCIEQTRITYE